MPVEQESELYQHQVIEASAGTGKTYTIERIVLDLLAKDVPLEQILLVTFTEKATAELKDKLRRRIERAIAEAESGPLKMKYEHAFENIDQAQIFTIHAFCLRVLQQFPFAHGQGSSKKMVSDSELLETCLREIQRTAWPEQYGKMLGPVLKLSGYDDPFDGGLKWDERLFGIATRFQAECGHRLRPDLGKNCAAALAEFETRAQQVRVALLPRVGPVGDNILENPFYKQYGCLKVPSGSHKLTKVLNKVLLWLANAQNDSSSYVSFERMIESIGYAGFAENSFRTLNEGLISNASTASVCATLSVLVETMEALRASVTKLKMQLTVDTANAIARAMAQHKRERGLQSFDDLLTRVNRALDPVINERAPVLLESLRARYRYAIVDEFQDTDRIQWQIFRRIFFDGNGKGEGNTHGLIVVGDPKQAIYSFRNADVHAYVEAREEIGRKTGKAPGMLGINYRTCQDLLTALNRLFSASEWFNDGAIKYCPVNFPEGKSIRVEILADRTERRALSLVSFPSAENMSQARRMMARFIGAEISRLLSPPGEARTSLHFRIDDEYFDLRANDICILLSRRSDSEWIEEELRKQGIPYSFYKKAGIWQSVEATHLTAALKAVGRPDDPAAFKRMLLSRFFAIPPERVAAFDERPPGNGIERLFRSWVHLSERRRWAELFCSMLEDTGLIFEEALAADSDRCLANYRYITDTLACEAYARSLDLLDILDFLKDKQSTSREDESNLQPKETDEPCIKLMTIHASKGLEFPIVFLAGGFGLPFKCDFIKYREDGEWIYDLDTLGNPKTDEANRENECEAHRLLYVALTRAMFKLYVPDIDLKARNASKDNKPSVTLLHEALEKAQFETQLPAVAGRIVYEGIASEPVNPTGRPPKIGGAAEPPIAIPKILFPSLDLSAIASRRIGVQSFSRLTEHSAHMRHTNAMQFTERAPHDDDDQPGEIEEDSLPAGAVAGNVLHAVLEKIDFALVKKAQAAEQLLSFSTPVRKLIDDAMREHLPGTDTGGKKQLRVAELLWHTLRSPLPQLSGLPLADLSPADRVHELEFFLPFDWSGVAPGIEDIETRTGSAAFQAAGGENFLTGFMDLVFKCGGRYYLADWKSNSLPAGYARAELQKAMQERRYDLQYRIYLQALARWLPRIDSNFKHQRDFGGIFYFFMRGMRKTEGEKKSDDGIYFHVPSEEDWSSTALSREIERLPREQRGA